MPIMAFWHQAINYLDGYSHNKNKIWCMANAKIKGAMPSEILEIKNNPPEPVNIVFIPNPDFSDNNEDIMLECMHDTNAEFDLRYSRKDLIKLEPHLCTCIDLKIALEILATTIVQLASKSSLAKKEINIREEIIDTRYVRNIIAMLQNDSEKTYVIDLNEKIAQAIFLSLVKIA
ncbi:hypothetical protein G9A89_011276 [Geosiphon pyriformis]|nr:hypothetical protein G9A89_011276 [Geosiphon pyriformis]